MSDVVNPMPGMSVSIRVEGSGLPGGGTPGDVLTKTESGAEWQKPTGSVQTVNGVLPDESGNVQIDIAPEDSEVIDMLIELDALPAVADADGAILTDESGAILMM